MGAKVDLAVRQSFELRRALQLPVLATGLDIAAGQAPAPVALVQRTVEAKGQFQLRALAGRGLSFWLLMSPWPLAVSVPSEYRRPGCRCPLEVDFRPLRAVERRVQVQALQAIVIESQLRALQA